MGAKDFSKNVDGKSHLKVLKNNNTTNKLIINTIEPKFVHKNNKGETIRPKVEVSF